MEVEHLATLERLRQSQRQDYLKVRKKYIYIYKDMDITVSLSHYLFLIDAGFSFWFSTGNRSPDERTT